MALGDRAHRVDVIPVAADAPEMSVNADNMSVQFVNLSRRELPMEVGEVQMFVGLVQERVGDDRKCVALITSSGAELRVHRDQLAARDDQLRANPSRFDWIGPCAPGGHFTA